MLKRMAKRIYPQQDLADRLREALDESGVSQAELARACDVTEQAVHDWLKTGRIGKQHFVTICHVTKKGLEFFFVGLKTWRRAAAIAVISLLVPLAVDNADAQPLYKNTAISTGCVLCKMLRRIAKWLRFDLASCS